MATPELGSIKYGHWVEPPVSSAEGDAYSSLWVPTGGGTDASYWLKRSKKEAVKARDSLKKLIELQ